MKVLGKVALTAVLVAVAGTAVADEKIRTAEGVASFKTFKPSSVRAEVGTLGYGAAISYNVTPKVGLTLGYNGGNISWSDGLNLHGVDYDTEMKNNNVYLNAEFRPFANPFYIATGVAYIDAQYGVNKTLTNSNDVVKINGKNYAGNGGTFSGKASYDNTIAPYLGVGFSPSTTSRFGMFGEVGAYYTGNPTAQFESTGLTEVGGSTTGAEAAERENEKYATGSKYEWLPVAKLGVTYRF